MSKVYMIIIAILTAIVLFQTFSSNDVIVCSNGDIVEDVLDCPINEVPTITTRQAETAVQNYGTAQANARSDQFTRVNVHRQGEHYFAQTLFTNRNTGNVAEVQFKIDGKTANVECVEGCTYLSASNESEDI